MPMSRRVFVKGLSAAGAAALGAPSLVAESIESKDRAVPNPLPTELHPLTAVPIQSVVVDDAFWSPKREVWRTVTITDCLAKFEKDGAFTNFDRVRDGLQGGHGGFPWFDGLVYEMIRAAADFMRSHPDPELEARLDGYIERIVAAAAKDPGGYVNTYTQLGEPGHRWGLNGGLEVWQHEFYNLGALVDAGVHYYRATGKDALLKAATRIADTMAKLVGPPPKNNLVPAHELPEEAALGLYELTKERRYLKLAEFWVESRGHNSGKPDWEPNRSKAEEFVRNYHDYEHGRPSWGAYAQDHVPVFEQETIEGHAVRATLLCSAVAALARGNGREEYRQSALRLWENMTYRRMHVTGGVGAYANDEKFGPDYVLPNDAYLETCAAVGAGFFHANMNLAFGDARFVDELERTLYNGILCGISLAGNTYTYQNPLVLDERRTRWEWHDCPCCPPMFLKMMGAMPGYIYATDADSAYVNLFVGGHASLHVKGTDVALRQATNYPWDGQVRISVDPATSAEFAVMVRIPGWCHGETLKVNGEKVQTKERVRGYVRLERTWKKGDVVELSMPMPVQALRAHPKVAENVGRVALSRGPLIYCIESADHYGDHGGEWEVPRLAQKPDFHTERWEDRLGGILAIHATATTSETEGLYAPEFKASKSQTITAIPFYANGNRGPVKMVVWLPKEE